MELRNLITFLKIVETGSFSKAAESLRYSQSTVTVQIQQLEEELHLQLFDRCNKKVILTKKGQTLEEYAKKMIVLSQKAASIGQNQNGITGTLCIAAMDSISSTILPQIMQLFQEKYPKVNIIIKSVYSLADAEKQLLSNNVDVALIFDDHTESNKRFQKTMLQKDALVFVASPSFFTAKKESTLADALNQTTLIISDYLNHYEPLMKSESFKDQKISVHNPMAAMKLALNGCGITLLPYFFVKKALDDNHLQIIDVSEHERLMWIQLIHLKEKYMTPQTKAFFELVANYFQK